MDSESIHYIDPTDVNNTGMDFRQLKRSLVTSDQQCMKGYDHGYLLYPDLSSTEDPVARLWSVAGEVQMEMIATALAIQLYTGNFSQACQGG